MEIKKFSEAKKYINKGGAYHWDRVSNNPLKRQLHIYNIYYSILKLLPKLENKKLLDLGCGDGILTYLIQKYKGGDIYGIDIHRIPIFLANKKKQEKKISVTYSVASCYNIPFPKKHFDFIISTDVIEHLEKPEAMLAEAYGKLKCNGIMIHSTPIRRKDMPTSMYHLKEFISSDYKKLLEKYLSNVEIIGINPFNIKFFLDKSKIRNSYFNAFSILFKINPYNFLRNNFIKNFTYMIGIGRKKENKRRFR